MKKLFEFALIASLVIYFAEYVKRNKHKGLPKPSHKKESVVMSNVDNPKPARNKKESSIENSESDNQTIVIRALGDVDGGDLDYAADVIRDFYGYKVEISSQVDIEQGMLASNGELNSVDVCYNLPVKRKTVFITDKLMYDNDGNILRGVASGNDKTVVVRGEKSFMKETIIHEIGHTLGLGHCEDKTCVMATHNDDMDSGDFCRVCKNKINL